MTAADTGLTYYAFSGAYVMDVAGLAKLIVQLQKTGLPPVIMPPTVGLPPGGSPGPLPAPTLYNLTIGTTTFVDSSGVSHAAGTWAFLTTTGLEFPKGGTYNTWLQYLPSGGGTRTSKVVPVFIDPGPNG